MCLSFIHASNSPITEMLPLSPFPVEEAEAQRGQLSCRRSHSSAGVSLESPWLPTMLCSFHTVCVHPGIDNYAHIL